MKIKLSRLIVIVGGFALVAAGFSAYLFHSKGKRAVENYRKQLVANGEKLNNCVREQFVRRRIVSQYFEQRTAC